MRPRPFRLFCDHRYLIHVFALHVSLKIHIRGQILRWTLKLIPYCYVIEHVDRVANVGADMLSRWAGKCSIFIALHSLTPRSVHSAWAFHVGAE